MIVNIPVDYLSVLVVVCGPTNNQTRQSKNN